MNYKYTKYDELRPYLRLIDGDPVGQFGDTQDHETQGWEKGEAPEGND